MKVLSISKKDNRILPFTSKRISKCNTKVSTVLVYKGHKICEKKYQWALKAMCMLGYTD